MLPEDEWNKVEHVVNRHDAAIIEEATTIAQLRREVALIIEALEKLDVKKFQGSRSLEQAARARYSEIIEQLKACHAVN